jgi:uncharacterized protein
MRNKILWTSIAGLAVLGLVFGLSGLPRVFAASSQQTSEPTPQGESAEPVRTISVNGTGKVVLTPDLATIHIGVHTENTDAQEAVASNTSQAQEVMDALLGFGIAEADIQTTNFSIYPRQEYNNEGQVTGITYVVDNTVVVTVRNLDEIGEILDGVVQAGANAINGIQFTVADPTEAYNAALAAGVENARARAEVLASAAGVELGEVQTISSYIGGGVVPVYRDFSMAAEMAAAEVPIAAGQTEISVEVNMVYTIR